MLHNLSNPNSFPSDYSVQVAINTVQMAPGKGEATVFTGQQTVASSGV
jgi:LEA14-like dessication related protein